MSEEKQPLYKTKKGIIVGISGIAVIIIILTAGIIFNDNPQLDNIELSEITEKTVLKGSVMFKEDMGAVYINMRTNYVSMGYGDETGYRAQKHWDTKEIPSFRIDKVSAGKWYPFDSYWKSYYIYNKRSIKSIDFQLSETINSGFQEDKEIFYTWENPDFGYSNEIIITLNDTRRNLMLNKRLKI